MANINFTDFESKIGTTKENTYPERVKVGYFNSLKDDGDETLVRIDYDSGADFTVTTVHKVLVDNKFWRNISCLKTLHDTADKCPLCASGVEVKAKLFVKLLEYSRNEEGKIVFEPKVWERGSGFVASLNEAMSDAVEDGKISAGTKFRDVVFKIKRIGAKGSLDTRYKVKVMNPSVCPESDFKKDFTAFKDFDLAHHSYSNKTAEEMQEYLRSGKFPEVAKKQAAAPVSPKAEPVHPGVEEDVKVFEQPAPAAVVTPSASEVTSGSLSQPATSEKPHRYNW